MNIERMQLLAEALEHIEERKDFIFDMGDYFYPLNEYGRPAYKGQEECGYAGCIVGLTHIMWPKICTIASVYFAAGTLDLNIGVAQWLFMGNFMGPNIPLADISAAQCAVAVRYLIANPDKLDLPIPL